MTLDLKLNAEPLAYEPLAYAGDCTFVTLPPLVETYGVSGRETAVREAVAKQLPNWAARLPTCARMGWPRSGVYASNMEAHPVLVHTGQGVVLAVFAPRSGYQRATEWRLPGRYSHAAVEVIDGRDLQALVDLIVALVSDWN